MRDTLSRLTVVNKHGIKINLIMFSTRRALLECYSVTLFHAAICCLDNRYLNDCYKEFAKTYLLIYNMDLEFFNTKQQTLGPRQ